MQGFRELTMQTKSVRRSIRQFVNAQGADLVTVQCGGAFPVRLLHRCVAERESIVRQSPLSALFLASAFFSLQLLLLDFLNSFCYFLLTSLLYFAPLQQCLNEIIEIFSLSPCGVVHFSFSLWNPVVPIESHLAS